MNKIYKTVWNAARHCLVVVSEALGTSQARGTASVMTGVVGALIASNALAFAHEGSESGLYAEYHPDLSGVIQIDGTVTKDTVLNNDQIGSTIYPGATFDVYNEIFVKASIRFELNSQGIIYFNDDRWTNNGTTVWSGAGSIQTFRWLEPENHKVNSYLVNNGLLISDIDTYFFNAPMAGVVGLGEDPQAFVENNGEMRFSKMFRVNSLKNNGIIVNNGGTIEWVADGQGKGYWTGSGTITGDGTGTVAFLGVYQSDDIPHIANTTGNITNQKEVTFGYTTVVNGKIDNVQLLSVRSADYFGGTLIKGDVNVGKLNLLASLDRVIKEPDTPEEFFLGVHKSHSYLEIEGDLTADTVNLDHMAVCADENNGDGSKIPWENKPEGLTVKGDMHITGNFNSFGLGWFEGQSVIEGTLNHGYEYTPFLHDDPTLEDMSVLTLEFADLQAKNIQNGGTIIVSNKVSTDGLINEAIFTSKDFHLSGIGTNAGSLTVNGDLTFDKNALLTSSGTFKTQAENIFTNLDSDVQDPLRTIGLSASLPEEVKSTLSDRFTKYIPGTLAQQVIDHMNFTGGQVIIAGVNMTETQRDDLVSAFKETFGQS